MVEWKDPKLICPTGTLKLELFSEQLLMRKARRLGEKAFYIKSYQEVTATRWPGGVEMYSQDPYSRWVTLKWDDNCNHRRSPRGGGVRALQWAP